MGCSFQKKCWPLCPIYKKELAKILVVLKMKLKKFAGLRVLSVLLEFIYGFGQPFVFSRSFSEADFAFILILYSCAVYFTFFDAGISKLSYARLRKTYVTASNNMCNVLSDTLIFYIALTVVVTSLFSAFTLSLSYFFANGFRLDVLMLFSMATGLNIMFSFFRSIYNALDLSIQFEYIDMGRKLINIAALALLFLDKTMLLTGVVMLVGLALIFLVIIFNLIRHFSIPLHLFKFSPTSISALVKENFSQSRYIFLFTISETVVYNAGFILIPFFLLNRDIIQYNLWMKIYLGIAVFMRIVTDVTLHNITRHYFNHEIAEAKKWFYTTIWLSLGLVTCGTIAFYLLQGSIFPAWVGPGYVFNYWLIAALLIMLIGNSMQHVSGSFLLSTGHHFKETGKLSMVMAIATITLLLFSLVLLKKLDICLLITSIVYITGSLLYRKLAVNAFNIAPVNNTNEDLV